MNKLTEIKTLIASAVNWVNEAIDGPAYYEDIKYLLALLEEKDKALAFYADEDNWGDDRYGCSKIFHGADDGYEIARKALNTSSNNEGGNTQ